MISSLGAIAGGTILVLASLLAGGTIYVVVKDIVMRNIHPQD